VIKVEQGLPELQMEVIEFIWQNSCESLSRLPGNPQWRGMKAAARLRRHPLNQDCVTLHETNGSLVL